nr:hypothetical protein [uncultured Cetobacterium sp.]
MIELSNGKYLKKNYIKLYGSEDEIIKYINFIENSNKNITIDRDNFLLEVIESVLNLELIIMYTVNNKKNETNLIEKNREKFLYREERVLLKERRKL